MLHNARRLSYAANLNRILDASAARYVLLMNTDMYFDPREQCLRRMVGVHGRPAAVRHWPAAGCITPTAPTPTPPGGSRRCR